MIDSTYKDIWMATAKVLWNCICLKLSTLPPQSLYNQFLFKCSIDRQTQRSTKMYFLVYQMIWYIQGTTNHLFLHSSSTYLSMAYFFHATSIQDLPPTMHELMEGENWPYHYWSRNSPEQARKLPRRWCYKHRPHGKIKIC